LLLFSPALEALKLHSLAYTFLTILPLKVISTELGVVDYIEIIGNHKTRDITILQELTLLQERK